MHKWLACHRYGGDRLCRYGGIAAGSHKSMILHDMGRLTELERGCCRWADRVCTRVSLLRLIHWGCIESTSRIDFRSFQVILHGSIKKKSKSFIENGKSWSNLKLPSEIFWWFFFWDPCKISWKGRKSTRQVRWMQPQGIKRKSDTREHTRSSHLQCDFTKLDPFSAYFLVFLSADVL